MSLWQTRGDSETGQRGFLLTSNQDYLEPYNKGVADAKLSLSQLQVLTISDSEQQAMFLDIENLMNQKFSEMQSTINLHFAKRFEESLAVVNSNKGKQLMDKIRMMLDVFNSHLIRKRDQQQTELINLQEKMRMIFILESVFFGIVLFFLTTIVSKTILQPINQLTKSAKAFEVDKEFIPVQIKSRDELSVLGRAFNTMADKATTAAKNLQVDVNKVKKERDKALVEAILDPLTGLSNRKYMEVELEKLMLASRRYGDDLSLIILDLDHFKKVNDTYGHVTGDTVLKAILSLIKDTMRASDLTIRYGGEEFVVVMHHTASDKATKKAEILRQKIESLRLAELDESGLTVSLGVTQFLKEDKSIESFISRADEALYKAKTSGRNQWQLI